MTEVTEVTTRRRGNPDSATRQRMLEAAARLMVEEGHAAVTTRRIAQELGVTAPLVHYYFDSMEELFVELLEVIAAENLERQRLALATPDPVSALWKLASHPAGAAANTEFASLATRSPRIRAAIATHAATFRRAQIDTLTDRAEQGEIDLDPSEVDGLVVLLTSLGRIIAQEHELGISLGHREARAALARLVGTPLR